LACPALSNNVEEQVGVPIVTSMRPWMDRVLAF